MSSSAIPEGSTSVLFHARLCGPHCRRHCKFSLDRYETYESTHERKPVSFCNTAVELNSIKTLITPLSFVRHEISEQEKGRNQIFLMES